MTAHKGGASLWQVLEGRALEVLQLLHVFEALSGEKGVHLPVGEFRQRLPEDQGGPESLSFKGGVHGIQNRIGICGG